MLRGECKLCVASYTKHAAAEEEADTRQQLKIGLRKTHVTMLQRWSVMERSSARSSPTSRNGMFRLPLPVCEYQQGAPRGRAHRQIHPRFANTIPQKQRSLGCLCTRPGYIKSGHLDRLNGTVFISLTSLQGVQLACHSRVVSCLIGACRRRAPAPAHDEDRGDEHHHTPDAVIRDACLSYLFDGFFAGHTFMSSMTAENRGSLSD